VGTLVGFGSEIARLKPPRSRLRILHGGAHHVAPKAASEVKAQAEAKFHMYWLV
jgi:hypothetical protein